MIAVVENHPSAPATPEMRLREFLHKADQFSSVIIVAVRKDDTSAQISWSDMSLSDLAFSERALAHSISQEFIADEDDD